MAESEEFEQIDDDPYALERKAVLEEDERLVAMVEDGSYFRNGREWYLHKFCYPIFERVFWLIIGVVLVFLSYNLFIQVKGWFPVKVHRPIILVNKNAEFKQTVKKMENPYEDADLAILHYLLKNYIKTREEFLKNDLDLLELDKRFKKVANNSTRDIALDYQRVFDRNTELNPISRIGRTGIRRVKLEDVKFKIKKPTFLEQIQNFNKFNSLPRAAIVTFSAKETNTEKNTKSTVKWQVNIDFNYSGVNIDRRNNKMSLKEFIVTDYKSKEISK
jgi:type IV secretory pathway component VirB8